MTRLPFLCLLFLSKESRTLYISQSTRFNCTHLYKQRGSTTGRRKRSWLDRGRINFLWVFVMCRYWVSTWFINCKKKTSVFIHRRRFIFLTEFLRVHTRADFNPFVNNIRSFSFSYKPHDKMFSIVGMKDVYCM